LAKLETIFDACVLGVSLQSINMAKHKIKVRAAEAAKAKEAAGSIFVSGKCADPINTQLNSTHTEPVNEMLTNLGMRSFFGPGRHSMTLNELAGRKYVVMYAGVQIITAIPSFKLGVSSLRTIGQFNDIFVKTDGVPGVLQNGIVVCYNRSLVDDGKCAEPGKFQCRKFKSPDTVCKYSGNKPFEFEYGRLTHERLHRVENSVSSKDSA
ncbi:hypothetical protein IWW50_005474, partial [Coemansia erecta]